MSISTGIMASEPEQDYVVTYQAEEITDTDTLIEIALAQPKSKARSATASDDQLEVKQLLEVREYKDGSIQKDFATTIFAGINEDGRAASRESFDDLKENGLANNNGVYIQTEMYYTAKYTGSGLFVETTIRVNRVVSVIYNNAQFISIYKLTHGYHIFEGFGDLGKVVEVYNPSVGVGYIIYSENSDFHQAWLGQSNDVFADLIVDTSKGSISTRTYLK